MSRELPPPGNYTAKKRGKIVIGDPEQAGGYLIAHVPYLIGSVTPPFADSAAVFLAKPDGTIYTNAVKNLKSVFKWDGLDFFALEEIESDDFEFDLVDCIHATRSRKVKDEQGNEEEIEVVEFKPSFLNAVGAGRIEPMDESSKKSIRAEYASKLKALFGGKAAKTTAKTSAPPDDSNPDLLPQKPATAPQEPPKRTPGAPPSRKLAAAPRTLSDEEVWKLINDKLAKENPKLSDDQIGEKATDLYIAEWKKIDKEQGELQPEQWGQVANALGL